MSRYHRGDVVLISFDPSSGHEPAKTRPALVLSNDSFNSRTSMRLVAPITSRDNGFPMHVGVPAGSRVEGFVCCEQVRTFDLESRDALVIGTMDPQTVETCARLVRLSL